MSIREPLDEHDVRERLKSDGDLAGQGCRVDAVPGGPALVRGASAVVDDDGMPHRTTRPVVAVCTCGLSQRAPWCDATHKVARAPGVSGEE